MNSAYSVAADTASLEASIEATFTGTFTVKRKTRTADGVDGFTVSETTVASSVDGAINSDQKGQAATFKEGEARVTSPTRFVLHLVAGTDVQVDDIVEDDETGEVYGVVTVEVPVSESVAVCCRVVRSSQTV